MVWYSGDLGTNQLNKTQFCHKKVMHKGYKLCHIGRRISPLLHTSGVVGGGGGGQPQEEGSEFSSEDGDLEYIAW